MEQLICPLDWKTCERDCPDRYGEGGCLLTTAQELGAKILDFGGVNVGMMFLSNVWPIGAHGMFSMAPIGEG